MVFFLVRACHLLYKNRFVRGSEGNASIRLGSDRVLIKPSEKSFRDLKMSDLIQVDMNGKVIGSVGKPSIETPLHLSIYKIRSDVNVVLHSHPLNVITFSLLERPLELLEVERNVHEVPFVKYMKPGSKKLASAISKEMENHNAVILGRHGLVTVGKSVAEAYNLTEVVDMNAEIRNRAMTLGYQMT
jgi:L-fuculose-phosphate aldolase